MTEQRVSIEVGFKDKEAAQSFNAEVFRLLEQRVGTDKQQTFVDFKITDAPLVRTK